MSDPAGIAFGGTTHFSTKQSFWKITYKEVKMLRVKTGMYWTDMRKIWWKLMTSSARDNELIEAIKVILNRMEVVPVLSGRLLDTIKKSMKIKRRSWYRTSFYIMFSFIWTILRPYPITGRVAHLKEIGYGELYFPTETIPNRTLLAITPGGNAKYLLNDAWAINNPVDAILKTANEILCKDVYDIFNNMVLTYIT